MDPLTHIVLTRAAVGKDLSVLLAGLGPDLSFYLTYPAWVASEGQARCALAAGTWPHPPRWMFRLHRFTHSLVVIGMVGLAVRLLAGRWPARHLAAWCLHIVIDIPSHSRDPWGPRFLWPLSDIVVDGVPWTEIPVRLWRSLAGRR